MSLAGKVAVVTGANGDQGRAVTDRYLNEGAQVLALDLGFDEDLRTREQEDDGLRLLAGDISDRSIIAEIQHALARFGSCSIVYNNAGVYLPGRGDGPAGDLDLDVWERILSINVTGALHVVRAALPLMANGHGGVIINVASLAGVVGSRNAGYTASKAALIGFTKSIALTYAHFNIRSVSLSLGPVDTKMMDFARGSSGRWEAILESVPLRRAASAREIAAWAAFLAADDASYANGSNIIIDGGRGIGI